MRLYVPQLRDKLLLTAAWTFTVYDESRNYALVKHMGYGYETTKREAWRRDLAKDLRYLYGTHPLPEQFTLPVGTVLSVDRIYIRNGGSAFDSITFRAELPRVGKKAPLKMRFWARLADCNQIEFDAFAPS